MLLLKTPAASGDSAHKVLLPYNCLMSAAAAAEPASAARACGFCDRIDFHQHGKPADHLSGKVGFGFGNIPAFAAYIRRPEKHINGNCDLPAAVAAAIPIAHFVYYRRRGYKCEFPESLPRSHSPFKATAAARMTG